MNQDAGLSGEEKEAMNQDLQATGQLQAEASNESDVATDELVVRAHEPEDKS